MTVAVIALSSGAPAQPSCKKVPVFILQCAIKKKTEKPPSEDLIRQPDWFRTQMNNEKTTNSAKHHKAVHTFCFNT